MIRFNDEDDGYAISRHARCRYDPKTDVVIASVSDNSDVLLGGAIFQDYTGASIQAHMAGLERGWMTRDFLWVCFDYCFNQLGCTSVFGLVPSYNDEALAVDVKLGFKEIMRIPGVFSDGDMVVMRMWREDCRWLRIKPRSVRSNKVTSVGNKGV